MRFRIETIEMAEGFQFFKAETWKWPRVLEFFGRCGVIKRCGVVLNQQVLTVRDSRLDNHQSDTDCIPQMPSYNFKEPGSMKLP